MTLQLQPRTSWWETYGRCTQTAPEAFDSERLWNLTRGSGAGSEFRGTS
jgi:hypothetical protein